MKRILLLTVLAIMSVHRTTSQNLLTNGDFEAGGPGIGFNVSGAGYTQISAPFSGTTVPGNYALATSPATVNTSDYIAGTDHSGTGNMLIVEGLGTNAGNPFFWESGNAPGGTICGLTAGYVYYFSYWIKSVSTGTTNAATQADIRLAVTNATAISLVSGSALAPLPVNGWQKVTHRFTASGTCVNIGLWNNNISAVGNDFAIDDLSLVAANATVTASGTGSCLNGTPVVVTFTANVGAPQYTFTYNINGGTNQTVPSGAANNTATITIPTPVAGTFNVNLVSVAYGATTIPQTGTVSVVVNPAPTADIDLTPMLPTAGIMPGESFTITLDGTPNAIVTISSPTTGSAFVQLDASGEGQYNIPYIAQNTTFSITSVTTPASPGVPACTATVSDSYIVYVNGNTCAWPDLNVSIAAPNIPCSSGECIELKAQYSNVGATTDYVVSTIPFCSTLDTEPVTSPGCICGTVNATGDDSYSSVITLPFDFSFYGICYNKVLIGTNGVVTFDTVNNAPGPGAPWLYNATIPNPGFPVLNAIFGVYQDTDIRTTAQGGSVTNALVQNVNYMVYDAGQYAAPNRVFVANFNSLPMYGCWAAGDLQTSQIILHEGTNIIDVYVTKRSPCNTWNNGNGLIGVMNQAGNQAVVPVGRNTGNWSTVNEAWRFYPKNIPATPTEIRWEDASGAPVGGINQNPVTVCPTATSTYTAIVKFPTCDNAEIRESITVTPAPPLPVNDPIDVPFCWSGPGPYTVPSIDQAVTMLTGVVDAWKYDLTYYESEANAKDYLSPITTLTPYTFATAPKTIYVRIDDVTSGCYNIRPFDIILSTGTITYPLTICNNIPTPVAVTSTAPTGGTYNAASVPPGSTLIIDPVTGAITPIGSDPATYTVSYTVGTCPPITTSVDIVACSCTVAASSTSETLCVNTPLPSITYSTPGATGASITSGSLPPGVTGTFSGGVFTVSGTPTGTGTFVYTVTVVAGFDTCTATTTINVTPNAAVALTSGPTTRNQTLCINTAINTITYAVANTTGVNVTGLPAGVIFGFNSTTGVVTISGTPTAAGTFPYSVATTVGCTVASSGGTIIVNPAATIVQTSPPATTNPTVCVGTPITNITFAVGSGANNATVLGLPAGITGSFNSTTNVFTISGTPTGVGTSSYTVTATGGCGAPSITGTITVTPNVTIALTSAAGTDAQTVCVNGPITNIEYTTTNNPANVTVSGLPAGITGTFAAGVFTISGSTASIGTFPYNGTTVGGCGTATFSGSITVGPGVTATLTSAPATANQTLCINTPINNITYALANGASGANITGLPAGVTGSFDSTTNVYTISGTPTADGPFGYTLTTTGGCGQDIETGTFTVNPAVTLTLSSAAGTDAQVVCTGVPITNITYATTNSPANVTVTGLPAGITGAFSGGVFTISGSSTVTGTISYTVSTMGGCGSDSKSGTITINPDVTIALTSAVGTDAQTVCINAPITNIEYTTTNNPITVNATGLPAGVTGNFVGGVYTLSGTPTVDGPFSYTLTTSGGCGTDTIIGTITVSPAATIVRTSVVGTDAQTVCISTPIANIVYGVGSGATGASVLGLPPGVAGTFNSATNEFTISGIPTLDGTFNYTVTATGGCGLPSLSGTIIVHPNVTIALTSVAGSDAQTVCINTPINSITYATTNGVTGVTDSGLPPGVTGTFSGGVYTLSGSPTATGMFNYILTTVGGCSVAIANGSIFVNPDTTISQTSPLGTESQVLCVNNSITPIVYTAANGATGVNVGGLPAGVTGTYISGVFTITGTPTVDGIFNYTVTTTGGCLPDSLSGTITVNPDPTITLASAPGTNAQITCISTLITDIEYTVANGATGAIVTGLPTGITGTFNSTTNVFTISGSTAATGTFNYLVTTTGGCAPASAPGTITINLDVAISLTSAPTTANQTVCVNTPIVNIEYTTVNGATGALTTGLPAGVTGNFVGGVYTLSGTPTVAGTFNYNVTTQGGCASASASGVIIVNPDTTIALTSVPTTANQTVCINLPITNIEYTVANGATGATVTGLPAGLTTAFNALTNTFTISGSPTAAGTFNYIVSTTGGCAPDSLGGTITVNPDVTIALTSLAATTNQTVCVSTPIAAITYALANTDAIGATITGLPAGVTGTYNSTTHVFAITGTPTVAGNYPYNITTSGGCSSASLAGNILVNPNATLTVTSAPATLNQAACIGALITPVTFAIGNGATSASLATGGGGLPPGITGTFAAGVFTISGSATTSGTFNYVVTTSGGCSADTKSGVIEIKPNVTLLLTSASSTTNQLPCLSTAIDNITYVPGNGATGATVTGLPPGVTSNFNGGVLTISGAPNTLGIFNYNVTTTGGCSSASLTGRIEVVPNASITLTSAAGTNNQGICVIQEMLTDITYQVGNGATGASIVSGDLPTGISANFAGGILTISGTPTESGTFTYTVKTTGGCSFATATGTITVHALPVIVLPNDGFICVDQSNNPLPGSDFELTSGLSAATHTFQWSDASGPIAGAVGSSYMATAPGTYSVQAVAIATGCVNDASTTVITSFPPKFVSAEVSTYFAEEQVVTVSVAPIGNYEYQMDSGAWQDSNQFYNLQSGYHTITVRDKIGCGELSTTIRIIDYPKFFTPNSDGYNDFWNIPDLADQPQSKIEIFDRYGKLLKEISPMGRGWDGTLNGHLLPSTDYWFKVYYNDENDVPSEFKAHFSLKR